MSNFKGNVLRLIKHKVSFFIRKAKKYSDEEFPGKLRIKTEVEEAKHNFWGTNRPKAHNDKSAIQANNKSTRQWRNFYNITISMATCPKCN